LSADYPYQRAFGVVGHDLGVDPAVALEEAEDDGLSAGALVDLDLAAGKGAEAFALVGDAFAEPEVDGVDRADAGAAEPGGVGGRKVQGKELEEAPKAGLAELGMAVVTVSHDVSGG